jgi:hypothetical protein
MILNMFFVVVCAVNKGSFEDTESEQGQWQTKNCATGSSMTCSSTCICKVCFSVQSGRVGSNTSVVDKGKGKRIVTEKVLE